MDARAGRGVIPVAPRRYELTESTHRHEILVEPEPLMLAGSASLVGPLPEFEYVR